ncbi:MAG: hypothetical protein ACJ70Z_09535, partial [Nitrososphaera sp.]
YHRVMSLSPSYSRRTNQKTNDDRGKTFEACTHILKSNVGLLRQNRVWLKDKNDEDDVKKKNNKKGKRVITCYFF